MSISTLAAILAVFVFAQVNGTSSPECALQSNNANATEGGEKKQPDEVVLEETPAEEKSELMEEDEDDDDGKPVNARKVLENWDDGSANSSGLIVRVGACLGEMEGNSPEGDKGLNELWEFTREEVRRVARHYKDGKPVYYQVESCYFDSKDLCKELLEGQAIEIQSRKGTGPYTALAGSKYKRGSRKIEVEWNGKTILDLYETNGAVLDVYRETDAKAFGELYERLASQARWLLGPDVGEISKLQWQSSGVAAKVEATDGKVVYLSETAPDGLKSKPEGLVSPYYGVYEMGPSGAKTSFFVIIDCPAGFPATLYVNRSGNGEMSKERGLEFTSQKIKRVDGSESFTHYAHVPIEIPFAEGKREANLKFMRLDPKREPDFYKWNMHCYADYGYAGTTTINGRPVPTVAIDNSCTGELMMSGRMRYLPRIWFDFNTNGKTDAGEIVQGSYFVLNGVWWQVTSMGNDGTIRIEKAFDRDSKPTNYSDAPDAIKIWLVGNPEYGDTPGTKVPDVLKAKAKELGHRLNVQSFKAEGFHDVYWNFVAKGEGPDVLVHDNIGILDGVETDKGKFKGISEKSGVAESLIQVTDKPGLFGAAALLVSSSHNHSKAKELVDKYEPTPVIPSIGHLAMLEPVDKVAVSTLAVRAYRDLANKDVESLKEISDELVDTSPGWSVAGPDGRLGTALPGIVEILDVRGTNRLAFVVATTSFSDQPMMFAFRRSTGNWKFSTVVNFYEDRFPLLNLMRNASDEEMESVSVETPLIISPSDGAKFPHYPSHSDFEWITSGELAVTYMVESKAEGFDLGIFHILESKEFESKDVIKISAPFRVGTQLHRWRVWAIGPLGDAAVSEWRTIGYTE